MNLNQMFYLFNNFVFAERVGFEPTRPLGQTVFKTVSATLNLSDYLSIVLRVGLEPTIFRVSDECLVQLSFRRIHSPTDRI